MTKTETTRPPGANSLQQQARFDEFTSAYNEVRPHSSLGYLTPAPFAAKIKEHDAAPARAMGRTAAVSGASALRPVAQPPRESKAETGVVVSS